MDVFDRMKSLFPTDSPLIERTRYLAECDASVFATIHVGVLFVMAFWSIPSRVQFGELKRCLLELDPDGRLELVVVDTDGCPELDHHEVFAGRLHGSGEMAWVLNGEVVCHSGVGLNPECIEPYTRHLLEIVAARG